MVATGDQCINLIIGTTLEPFHCNMLVIIPIRGCLVVNFLIIKYGVD